MHRHVPNLITGSRLILAAAFFALLSFYQYQGRAAPLSRRGQVGAGGHWRRLRAGTSPAAWLEASRSSASRRVRSGLSSINSTRRLVSFPVNLSR